MTISTPSLISRRTMLGVLGASAATPLVGEAPARAATSHPKRLIVLYTQEGVIPSLILGDLTPGPLTRLAPAMSALTPFQKKLTLVGGLAMFSCINQPWEGEPFTSAHNGGVHLFTGSPCLGPAKHPKLGYLEPAAAGGPSVDQWVAQKLPRETPHSSLLFGVSRGDIGFGPGGRIAFSGRGHVGFDPEMDPRKAFDRLFGMRDAATAARRTRARKSVLDFARRRIERHRASLGAEDGAKLDQHLQSLRELELELAHEGSCAASWEAVDGNAAALDVPRKTSNVIALTKLALSCDLTRVVSIQLGTPGGYGMNMRHVLLDGKGIDHDEHEVSHAGDVDRRPEKQLACTRWKASVFAELLAALESVKEGNGTLLDNTLVVWSSQMATPWDHAMAPLTFILAGGCGGAVKTGQFVAYGEPRLLKARSTDARRVDDTAYAAHNRLLLTVCHAMGLSDTTVFGSERYSMGGVLPGLLA